MSISVQCITAQIDKGTEVKTLKRLNIVKFERIVLAEVVVSGNGDNNHRLSNSNLWWPSHVDFERSEDGIWTYESPTINFPLSGDIKVFAEYNEKTFTFSVWGSGFIRASCRVFSPE